MRILEPNLRRLVTSRRCGQELLELKTLVEDKCSKLMLTDRPVEFLVVTKKLEKSNWTYLASVFVDTSLVIDHISLFKNKDRPCQEWLTQDQLVVWIKGYLATKSQILRKEWTVEDN